MNTDHLIEVLMQSFIDGCRSTDAGCFMDEEFRATFVDTCTAAVWSGYLSMVPRSRESEKTAIRKMAARWFKVR